MKRWETMAAVTVATLGILAPAMVRADVPGYTFKVPVKIGVVSGIDISDAGTMQIGDVNNKGQFTMNFSSPTQEGEREYVWDGLRMTLIADPKKPLADGAIPGGGNTWSPHGINNLGVVAWTVDPSEGATGGHYVMAYDTATGAYTIVQRPGDPAPGGGVYGDGANGPRQIADINDLNQVVFPNTRAGADGSDYCAIYMYDLGTKKATLIAANGTKTADGKTIVSTVLPDANNASQIAFGATVDGTSYGMYRAEADGTITPIILAGSTIDGVVIGSARRARMNNNGDIVALVDVNGADGGAIGETGEDMAIALYTQADKAVHLIVKLGSKVPGGTLQALETNIRAVGITDSGHVFFKGVLAETASDGTQKDGIYRWDPATKAVDALLLGDSTVAGLGKVGGVTKGNGGVTGYHLGVSGNGHVAFPAVVDGVEGYVVAAPPAP